MNGVRIGLLGELEVRIAGQPVVVPPGKQQLVLTALAVRRGEFVTTDELIDQVWAEAPPAAARTTLRGHVKRLRAQLSSAGRHVIESRRGGYRLVVAEEETDLHRFRLLWRQARACADTGVELATLRAALDLWRGPALSGLDPLPWVAQLAAGVEEERLQAVERHVELLIGTGRATAVLDDLRRELVAHPFRETLWGQLILGLHRAGRTADALLTYDKVRRLLADRLGVEPSTRLRALHQQVLTEEPVRDDSVASGITAVPGFVGRQRELAALDELFDDCQAPRVVVVDGPAGVGKTALALHWASSAAHRFPGGRICVNLRGFHPRAPLSTGEALAELLRGLGIAEGDIPAGVPARVTAFRDAIRHRRMLVVLDNARDAAQVRPLLPGPAGTVLITSQDQLRGLVVHNAACRINLAPLTPREGMALVAAESDPELAYELVELCAGLPLALRIAAEQLSRIPGLTLARLVHELRDEQNRLGLLETGDESASVRTVLRRAHELLGPDEADLLRTLARGAKAEFELTDAARLAGVDLSRARSLLSTLVSVNLLQQRSLRGYYLHELQRAVAAG